MARIEGVDLPRNKRVEIGLTYIYGIGLPRARQVLAATNINPDIKGERSNGRAGKPITRLYCAALQD
jgi:ribosomal protein S13